MKVWIAGAAAVALLMFAIGLAHEGNERHVEPLTLIPPEPDLPRSLAPSHEAPESLRALGREHGVLVGAALMSNDLADDETYREVVASEFSIVTTENALKLGLMRLTETEYNFAPADSIVNFALRNGQLVRGHVLVWHEEVPRWVNYAELDRQGAMALLEQHIKTTVGRYAGRIHYWDVVNEAIDNNGNLRNTLWLRLIGPEYIDMAFRWAQEADPTAKLYYNDYNVEWFSPKSHAVYDLVQGMIERRVPIHGLGFQGHFTLEWFPSLSDISANMARFAALGLELQFTEVDVRLEEPITPEKLQAQAEIYWQLMAACVDEPACKAFITWGVTDRYSWIRRMLPGFDAGLLFDDDYKAKPAFWALRDVLEREPGRAILTPN